MTIHSGARDYYTGDLEKRFNYFWDCTLNNGNSPWFEFVTLTDHNPNTPAVRLYFTRARSQPAKPMSKQAYYRWLRSLQHQRDAKITATKEPA